MKRFLILPFLLLSVFHSLGQENEYTDLVNAYDADQALTMIQNRYLPIDPEDKGPNPREFLDLGEWKRLPITGFEAKGLAYANIINTEKRFFSADSRYFFLPLGSVTYGIYSTETGNKIKDIILPNRGLSDNFYWHHKLPIVMYSRADILYGEHVETGQKMSVSFPWNIGGLHKEKWARVAGGDGNDISPTGHWLVTHDSKFGEASVVQFSDEGIEFDIVGADWILPEGTDYAMVAWDGAHVLVVGQKNSGFGIDAYTLDGERIGEVYGNRGHIDSGPFLTSDGRKISAFSRKYNPKMAREAGGNSGDVCTIAYEITDGQIIEYGRFRSISGIGKVPQNLGAEHSHSGYPGRYTYLESFQINKEGEHPYKGSVTEISFDQQDLAPRLIAYHFSGDGPFDTQPEACLSPDGLFALIKFGAAKQTKGLVALVRLSPRMAPEARQAFLDGQPIASEQLRLSTAYAVAESALSSSPFPMDFFDKSADSILVHIPNYGPSDSVFVEMIVRGSTQKKEAKLRFSNGSTVCLLGNQKNASSYEEEAISKGIAHSYYLKNPPPSGSAYLLVKPLHSNGFTIDSLTFRVVRAISE